MEEVPLLHAEDGDDADEVAHEAHGGHGGHGHAGAPEAERIQELAPVQVTTVDRWRKKKQEKK